MTKIVLEITDIEMSALNDEKEWMYSYPSYKTPTSIKAFLEEKFVTLIQLARHYAETNSGVVVQSREYRLLQIDYVFATKIVESLYIDYMGNVRLVKQWEMSSTIPEQFTIQFCDGKTNITMHCKVVLIEKPTLVNVNDHGIYTIGSTTIGD